MMNDLYFCNNVLTIIIKNSILLQKNFDFFLSVWTPLFRFVFKSFLFFIQMHYSLHKIIFILKCMVFLGNITPNTKEISRFFCFSLKNCAFFITVSFKVMISFHNIHVLKIDLICTCINFSHMLIQISSH